MWHDMFVEQIPLAEKVIRTIGVYALLMVLFRLTGKRGLAALNTFDFIVIFLLSNVVQNAVIGNDNSLLGGMVGAVTLVALNAGINRLTTISPIAERLFEGRATTVIDDGCVIDSKLRRLGLRRSQLEHAVRLQNGNAIAQIDYGRLEPGGQRVLTLKRTEQAATKADVAELIDRLSRVEEILTTHR
jgi:uncharacterized membrane protein YcaP (DUF421 family)